MMTLEPRAVTYTPGRTGDGSRVLRMHILDAQQGLVTLPLEPEHARAIGDTLTAYAESCVLYDEYTLDGEPVMFV